jgi:hypothetical protein
MTEENNNKKIIIAMNGNDKNGKNDFINLTAKRYVVRHRNFYDILSKNITWYDDKESILYLQFLKEYKELTNKYFNLEANFLYYNINNFLNKSSSDVLFLHAISKEVIDILRNDYDVITIHIHKKDGTESLNGYDYVLEYPDDNFEDFVNQLLDKLFIDEEEGVAE